MLSDCGNGPGMGPMLLAKFAFLVVGIAGPTFAVLGPGAWLARGIVLDVRAHRI